MKSIAKKTIRNMCRVWVFLVLLVAVSVAIIVLFGAVYMHFGSSDAFKLSLNVFMETGLVSADDIKAFYEIIIFEKVCKEILIVIISVNLFIKLLEPKNHFEFSDFIIFDTENKKIAVRYWIMLPKNSFLYDVKISAVLTDSSKLHRGVDGIDSEINVTVKKNELIQARGVREATITVEKSEEFQQIISKMKENKNIIFYIIIRGNDNKGRTYNYTKKYTAEDVLYDCEFASIHSQDFCPNIKKVFFRYQNFNKVYVSNGETEKWIGEYPEKRKHILTKEQMGAGIYKGKGKTKAEDFLSQFFSLYFNRSLVEKISRIIAKKKKQH